LPWYIANILIILLERQTQGLSTMEFSLKIIDIKRLEFVFKNLAKLVGFPLGKIKIQGFLSKKSLVPTMEITSKHKKV
jgi:hypothetical protein